MIKDAVGEGRRAGMTNIALLRRCYMIGRFGNRSHGIPRIVAGRTGGDNSRVVHRHRGKRCRAGMAAAAVLPGQVVVNHIIFRRQSGATDFVTGGALPRNGCIVNKSCRRPARRLMTGVALRRGRKMVLRLPGRDLPIVTVRALTCGAGIVNKTCGDPARRLMTGIALRRGRNMARRLARGHLAIVTV